MSIVFKVAAVFIGTIVGAGLASGQEIMLFFSKFGKYSFIGLIVCCLLYIIFAIIIINFCYTYHFKSYKELIRYVLGSHFGVAIDYLTTFFIFSGNVIMLSGSGAMLHEYFNIPKIFGILVMSFASFCIMLYSTRGLITINSIIVPLSSTIILILGLLVFFSFRSIHAQTLYLVSPPSSHLVWPISTLLYASFNILTVSGILCPLTNEIPNKKSFIYGVLIGSVVLFLLSFSINFSILFYAPESFNYEIPNLYAARFFGVLLPVILLLVIWFEMLSTEISELYSLGKALASSMNFSFTKSIAGIIIISIPLSLIGFSRLMGVLYPLSGCVGGIFIISCLIKYIRNKLAP